MSVRDIAREMYRVVKRIEKLEKELAGLDRNSERYVEVERELRSVEAERHYLRSLLEGAKA